MPIRKIEGGYIAIVDQVACKNSDHNPPSMLALEPGAYEHTCPSCGKRSMFYVMPKVMK